MATSGKTKAGQQPVLTANVPRILAELQQLAATNASKPLADNRSSGSIAQTMVIRGK